MKTYGLSLKLDMGNAAFEGAPAAEAARILRRLADKLENDEGATLKREERANGYLWDANGNNCGTWEAKERRLRA